MQVSRGRWLVKGKIKHVLAALIDADHATPSLTRLARQQIEAVWNDLSATEISELDAWLLNRQITAKGRAQIEWTYVRAVFTTILQDGGPLRAG
jgi:hypothetical protein